MTNNRLKLLTAVVVAAGCAVAFSASAAIAQSADQGAKPRSTPDSFSWKFGPDGKPVRKSRVVTSADGSTREEVPLGGKCVRVIERSADGTVKRSDQC